jgi:hypothetical protein
VSILSIGCLLRAQYGNHPATCRTGGEAVKDRDARCWELAEALVATHRMVIDRPAGSAHPTFPHIVYPFDDGFPQGTGAVDGGGVDCWRGSLDSLGISGAIATVDVGKGDAEVNGSSAVRHTRWRPPWPPTAPAHRRRCWSFGPPG